MRTHIVLTPAEIQQIQRLRAAIGMRETARRLGIAADTAYRAVASHTLYRGTATQIRLGLSLATMTEPRP